MKEKEKIWGALLRAEKKARASKYKKLWNRPLLYPALMVYDYIIYPYTRKSILIQTKTFFGITMKTSLPSGTDIWLHAIKAHDSEIRFAKFLVRHLKEGETFIDVGAHYGYYSLLAEALMGPSGRIYAVEASATSAVILKENTRAYPNITVLQAAASDTRGHVTFYEYPGPYAESNTTVKDAYKGQKWIQKIKQIENKVPTIMLDDLLVQEQIERAMFKVDAEGGEAAVLRGTVASLKSKDLIIVMEYLSAANQAPIHDQAVWVLQDCGYKSHGIDPDGKIFPVTDIDGYLKEKGLVSDNLVFIKNQT
jgi:FkbM family methyltransferase